MADIIHRVGIKAPISDVYAAVSTVEGVAGWWTKQTTGVSKPGGTIDARFLKPSGEEMGAMTMEVTALEPDKKVHWRFTKGPEEWIGTDATFDLYQDGEYTILLFGHRNWREPVEFMSHCSMKWATFMLSLRELVETGRGKPSPNDLKIDNWN
jgi:uncharacterized protein YndB with AHSA1/START domain